MKNISKFTSTSILSALIAVLLAGTAIPAYAVTHNASSNVVVVNQQGTAAASGVAGSFPTLAVTAAGYTVTFKAASAVNSLADLGSADTVFFWEFCNIASFPNTESAVISFLQNGGKLIIWDSDACNTSDGTNPDYSFLSAVGAQFTVSTPGQTGSFGGSLTITENNTFLAGLTQANLNTLVTTSDAVGDLNVIASSNPSWCATLSGTNILGSTGFADAYSAPSSLTGAASGMIVWDGLDTNYITYPTPGPILTTMILNQLAHGWGPAGSPQVADLTCGVTLTGISLAPSTASNPINSSHTVTASVYTVPGLAPIAGANVTFTVTAGPNAGVTGIGVTDAAGHATFTYHDSGGAGTDTIVATFTDNSGLHTSNAVEKIWVAVPVGVPEFGATATLIAAVAFMTVAFLSRRTRHPNTATLP